MLLLLVGPGAGAAVVVVRRAGLVARVLPHHLEGRRMSAAVRVIASEGPRPPDGRCFSVLQLREPWTSGGRGGARLRLGAGLIQLDVLEGVVRRGRVEARPRVGPRDGGGSHLCRVMVVVVMVRVRVTAVACAASDWDNRRRMLCTAAQGFGWASRAFGLSEM